MVSDDEEVDAGFDSGIQDLTYVSRVNPIYGENIISTIDQSAPKFLYGHYRQDFETECRSYHTMTYLLSSFLLISLLFTLPYIVFSSKRQRFIENQYSIPALQSEFRTKFNSWIFLILIFMVIQNIGQLILDTECPLYPYADQDAGGKAKSWIAFILIPLSQAMIDYGLVYIASLSLRTLLQEHTSDVTLGLVFVLSFITTMITLVFKIVDTRYDMLVALVFPLFKFFPFILSVQDAEKSSKEFRSHLMSERTDHTNQGKLITLYRLFATFR